MDAAEERAWNVLSSLQASSNRLDTRFGFVLTAQLALAVYVASVLDGGIGAVATSLKELILFGVMTLVGLLLYLLSVLWVISDLFQAVTYKARSKRHALLLSDWDIKKGGAVLPSLFIQTTLQDVADACDSLVRKNDERLLRFFRANLSLMLSLLCFVVFTSGLYNLPAQEGEPSTEVTSSPLHLVSD